MGFYAEIKRRAEELGGSAVWEEKTVGHGTFERVLVVYPPPPKVSRRQKSNNRLLSINQVLGIKEK